jgi:hypothetical protein
MSISKQVDNKLQQSFKIVHRGSIRDLLKEKYGIRANMPAYSMLSRKSSKSPRSSTVQPMSGTMKKIDMLHRNFYKDLHPIRDFNSEESSIQGSDTR